MLGYGRQYLSQPAVLIVQLRACGGLISESGVMGTDLFYSNRDLAVIMNDADTGCSEHGIFSRYCHIANK